MKKQISVGIFLITSLLIVAQESPVKFKHLTVQDGLSRSWVKCIYQDKQGYLWVGTADGLNRYNGISFTTYRYKSGDPNSINNNNILLIYEDRKGNIWIGSQSGLNLYNRENDKFIPVSAINNYISCIYECADGRFLIGSPGGLFLFNPENLTAVQIHSTINIADILKDSNNNFWLATYNGLSLLDTSDYSCKVINPDKKFGMAANNLVRKLFQDSKGGIWIGTESDGLRYMTYDTDNPQNPRFINFKNQPGNLESINEGAIYSIAEDNKGLLWIGIENGGLNLLNLNQLITPNSKFKHLAFNPVDPEGISDNSIHCVYRDKQNTMWIGTYGNGINYCNSILQKFDHYMQQPGSNKTINSNRVNAIYEEDNYLWIGTEAGLNVLDKHKRTFEYYQNEYNNPRSIGSNAVWAIFRDSRKNLWIGTWGGGLNLFNESSKTFTRFENKEKDTTSIGSNNMLKIIESQDNQLWIATMSGGLNRYDYNTKKFNSYRLIVDYYNSISGNWVVDLLESDSVNLWISTTVAVDLYNRQTKRFINFTHNPSDPKSISYNGANCIFKDSRDHIWIGTSNGLNFFVPSDSTFLHYYKSDGLCDNIIQAIEEDDHGNLWISTNNGVSEFINAVTLPKSPTFKNFNINDGLQGNEFNSRTSFKNKNGLIYFGGGNGYNVFDPDKIETNPYSPNLVFTGLLINNKPVAVGDENSPLVKDISLTKELKLNRKHSVFTIEFAALNLLAPENNKYAFYLKGFEKDWNYVGNQHSATYTNLDPGRYTFRVKASNNDGIWNEQGITLDIIVMPAWWQTWVARAIYLLIIILAIYYFRKHTIISVNLKNELWKEHIEKQKTEELAQLKNQFLTNISHELRTPITLIIGPLKQLVSNNTVSSQLDMIYKNASRLKTLVDQILDFSKIESQMMKVNLDLKDLVYLIDVEVGNFIQLAGQKKITLALKSNLSNCLAEVDEDKLIKILSNLLSNGIKNTPETGTVSTTLFYDKKTSRILIKVSDTGEGICEEEMDRIFDRFYTSSNTTLARQGTGIGLNLTKKLVELLHGTISVKSYQGQGSTFCIELPIKPVELTYYEFEKQYTNMNKELQTEAGNISDRDFIFDYSILIIDDNPEMCDYIESILSDEYNVIKECNPLESFNHLINVLPDLIISDVMMPELDGFELSKKIKNDQRFSHIPLILLTAKVGTEDQIIGYDTGADDYINKPFEAGILKARVRNLIRQKENLRQHFIGRDGIINPKIKANTLDVRFMEDILDTIKTRYMDPEFNVNHIIEKLGMSRSVFYKKFKALSVQPINDLVKNFRLNKACELLSGNHHTVSQVAYECGFSDPAYFSKVFKEYFKVSPKDYTSNNMATK